MPMSIRPSLLLCSLVLLGTCAYCQSPEAPHPRTGNTAATIEFTSESDLAKRMLHMNEVEFSVKGMWLSRGRLMIEPRPLPPVGTQLLIERVTPMEGRGSTPPRFALTAQGPSEPRRWSATLVGRVERDVLTAARTIRRGDLVHCGYFNVSRRAWVAEAGDAIPPPCLFDGKTMAGRYLAAGDVLRRADLQLEAAVTEMAPVTIRVAVGQVVLDTSGTALESGDVGDRVRVRPSTSRHSLLAIVSGPRSVVIAGEANP